MTDRRIERHWNVGKNNPMYGKPMAPHVKSILLEANKKRQVSPLVISNLNKYSQTHKGVNSPNFGKPMLPQTKAALALARQKQTGDKCPGWKGGKIRSRGYILIWCPNHPFVNATGYIQEHRLIAEKALGRYLKRGEMTHHINGNKADNHNSNLLICSLGYHRWLHAEMNRCYMQKYFGEN
jgi:hypothetical protein